MPIELPRAGAGSAGGVRPRRGGVRLPDAGDVPQERVASDPRLDVPDFAQFAGSGLEGIGTVLGDIGERLAAADERARTRTETVERARGISSYNETAATELRRIQTEEDPSSQAVMDAYGKFLRDTQAQIIEQHAGGPESKAALTVRLEQIKTVFSNDAGGISTGAQIALVETTMGESLNNLVANARENPGDLANLFASLDAQVDDMAPALTPEGELTFRNSGRELITVAAIESLLDRGAFRDAQEILAQTPGLSAIMSPESQSRLQRRIADFEQAEINAETAGLAKLAELETILGRPATPLERARHAGVASPAGERTVSQKIAEVETALERPLSAAERSRVAGLEPQTAASPEGKLIQDREMFASEFGEDSEQVRAFDEAVQNPNEPPQLNDIAGQRKEFTKLSGEFVNVRNSFNRVTASVTDASPAGDLALIFNFMKVLDPGSVVRESEFAQAAATGSFGERLRAAGERILAGKRLTDVQREDFRERAEMLFFAQLRNQLRLEATFNGLAISAGMNPADVVIDFIGPFRAAGGGQPLPSGEGGTPEPVKPRFQVDLEGNIIGGP